ncbi:TPA: erythromycin resistance leader peptide, partial [Streptococcus agalactiae]
MFSIFVIERFHYQLNQ